MIAAIDRTWQRWTPAEDRTLRELWERGEPFDRVRAELRRGPGSIRNRVKDLKLFRPKAWTETQDAVLLAEYGRPGGCTRGIARRLGKTVGAVKQRAMKLGLKSYKWWAPEDLDVLRARYGQEPADAIARDVGRTRHQVHRQAAALGLHRWPRLPVEQIERVQELYAQGLPDLAIAAAIGVTGHRVKHIRRTYIGRPPHPDPDAKRRGVANQLKTLGLSSPTELRTRAFALFAVESGWPADLRPREVQILNALVAADRPLTARELSEAIGMPTGPFRSGKRRVLLAGNGPGGTYTATLMRRGLIHAIRHYRGGRAARMQLPSEYLLTPLAIDMRVRWQNQQPKPVEPNHVRPQQPEPAKGPAANTRAGAGRVDPVPA